MKRPIGLTFSAIVLGLLAAATLLFAALGTFAAFAIHHLGSANPALAANPHPPSATYLFAVTLGTAFVMAAVAVWEGFTVFGLFKLRNWARYSILVLGGLLALFGLISALAMFFLAAIGNDLLPPNPQVPAHTMQGLMTIIGLFYLTFAVLGGWWLVYYNLRTVKNYFLPVYATEYNGSPYLGTPPPPPAPGRFAHVPTSIVVVGCFYLAGAFFCALCAFIPVPVFFMGVLFSGWGTHLLYLGFACIAGYIGWGLLKLDNRARLTSYGLIGLGAINFALLATPWGRAHYADYNSQLYARLYSQGLALTPAPPPYVGHLLLPSLLFCVVFYGIQIWIIERHRKAFLDRLK